MTRMSKRALSVSVAMLGILLAARGGAEAPASAPTLSSHAVPIIEVGGLRFRDLDRNGRLTPYEDWRLTPEARAKDLVSRMTLEEKAGAMMHSTLVAVDSPVGFSHNGYDNIAVGKEIADRKITSFITRLQVSPRRMAEENNKVQDLAEKTRLAIPVTVSTDPRHHFQHVLGASSAGSGYSQWPETLGFAALRDPALMQRFADIARQEYRATGIQMALSPQADLFTEPRWPRGTGTFGSDPALTRALVKAYVEGFQGSDHGLTGNGVITVVKHWVGYGATPQGWDGHNHYGRFVDLDDQSLALHIEPFKGAFEVNVAGVMPTYSIVRGPHVAGKALEPVGAGFNRQLLTDLLRGTYGFRGLVLSDWAITRDCTKECSDPQTMQPPSAIAMPWGVENLSPLDRYAKGINAGIDQFGGVSETQMVVDAVHRGLVSQARIDEATQRILESKFALGLFENPFVDPNAAEGAVNSAATQSIAFDAQAQAQVLLKNEGRALPLKAGTRVWLHGIDAAKAQAAGLQVVDSPEQADFALVRVSTPFERPHPNYFFGSRQNEGRLDYRPGTPDYDLVASLKGKTRVVLAAFTDRPAVMTQIAPLADAILVNFGVSDDALLAVLNGRQKARGRLPFELPRSMAAVEKQNPALPDDSGNPLYLVGAGLVEGND
ncbi:glycoside hydrolase family 3 protein [Sphingobium sp. BYY-5]|uniref:glycoside hydrolase family 3 protein n=1 Tax=Sphingobium sp. BYY-5 TaxID=2926400 RepID=UPI001FA7FDE6|nr:glycoside hydrolase family 3 N-terminal domain-containing protein [Sphingobium sp. BYY-5]MCI4589557.1 glycoside hydrolase family 3 protein [Sphingobium sp. BYY-5]